MYLKKEPLFKKIEQKAKEQEVEKEREFKEVTMLRKQKFKPIIQEELHQFSSKVDSIVEYLTSKRQAERNQEEEKRK